MRSCNIFFASRFSLMYARVGVEVLEVLEVLLGLCLGTSFNATGAFARAPL